MTGETFTVDASSLASGVTPGQESGQEEGQINDFCDISGSFGLWQKLIFLGIGFIEIAIAFSIFSTPFLVPAVPFTCDLDDPSFDVYRVNDTFDGVIRKKNDTSCSVIIWLNNDTVETPCRKWIYQHKKYKFTYTEKLDLVCDRAWIVPFSNTVGIVGDLVSSVIFSSLADVYGRRLSLFGGSAVSLVGGIVTLFAPNPTAFILGRFLAGASGEASFITSFVLLIEVVGPAHRTMVGILIKIAVCLGIIATGAAAYWLRNAFYLQIVCCAPLLAVITIALLLPESPRWLLVAKGPGGMKKVKSIVAKATKYNGLKEERLDEKLQTLQRKLEDEQKKLKSFGYLDLIRTKKSRRKICTLLIIWCMAYLIYISSSFDIMRLDSNAEISFLITSAIEIPAILFIYVLARMKGSKTPILCGFFISTVTSVAAAVFRADAGWSMISAVFIVKLGARFALVPAFNYTTELFPTVIRSQALGLCLVFSKMLALLSPYVKEVSDILGKPAVFGMLGCLSLLALVCTLFLPNTKGLPIPETLKDGEKIDLLRPRDICA